MPTVSMFFGISIRMYYDDHAPPHFHAYYGNDGAAFIINTLAVRDGHLPPRVMAMVLEWAAKYRSELRVNWQLAAQHEPLNKIPPLE